MMHPMVGQRAIMPLLAGLGLTLAVLVLLASPASAHASFVQASPGPGSGVAQAPGDVVIRFTEPLVHDLSKIEVVDRDGRDVSRGPTQAVEGDAKAIRRPLGLLSPGSYEVRWTTVSPLDGHTLKGRYTFAVGATASPTDSVSDGPVDSEGWLGLVGRYIALTGLTLWAGFAVSRRAAARAGVPEHRLDVIGRAAPLAVATGGAASLVSSAVVAAGSISVLDTVVLSSTSGRLRLALVLVAVAGVVIGPARLWLVRGLVVAAVLAEAASGHAASSPIPTVAIPVFAIHLGAAGVWIMAVAAALMTQRPLSTALGALAPYAVVAAGVAGVTGVVNAGIEVTDAAYLTSTAYGRVVIAKAGAFGLVALLGMIHARARRREDTPSSLLRFAVRGEAAALAVVLGVATALVGFPNPPADAEAQERATETDPLLTALEEQDAVSLAQATDRLMVALTVLPPRPGPLEIRVQVLGAEPGDALRSGAVTAVGPGGATTEAALHPCATGFGCYRGQVETAAEGMWRFTVAFASNDGPVEATYALPLPTSDGADEFERMRAAMRTLESAVVHERLADRTDGPVVVSQYTFGAPDRMRWTVEGGSDKIALGERGFSRSNPEEAWEEHPWPDPGFSWPEGFYDSFFAKSAAHRILGTDTIEGVETRILAFTQPELKAWYRVWVGTDDGRIRRLEMRAERHIMDQTYRAFDEPVSIEPPRP